MFSFLFGALLVLIILLVWSFRILREYERGVVFNLGRYWAVKGPGWFILIPVIQQMVKMDLRTVVLDVPPQDVITRDNVKHHGAQVHFHHLLDHGDENEPSRPLHRPVAPEVEHDAALVLAQDPESPHQQDEEDQQRAEKETEHDQPPFMGAFFRARARPRAASRALRRRARAGPPSLAPRCGRARSRRGCAPSPPVRSPRAPDRCCLGALRARSRSDADAISRPCRRPGTGTPQSRRRAR